MAHVLKDLGKKKWENKKIITKDDRYTICLHFIAGASTENLKHRTLLDLPVEMWWIFILIFYMIHSAHTICFYRNMREHCAFIYQLYN